MLLSHRIATSEKFLTLSPLDVRNRAELRGKILRATKIIVPTELMFVFSGRGVVGDLECIQQIIREAYGEHASTQEQQKKNNLFHEYSRLPFSVVFFENTTGGILAEELKDGYRLSMVTPQGEVSVYSIAYSLLLQQKDVLPLMKLDLHLRTTRHTPQEAILFEKLLMAFERLREDDQQSVSPASYLIGVLNACLFLNARNTVVHRYQLSRKEAGVIPKSLLPHFTYRVLDVFRERQAYENVKELEDFLQTTKTDVIKRRVHLVRGHFKNTKHGVFWWNAFTRCRKNEATVGVVQKDYRLCAELSSTF